MKNAESKMTNLQKIARLKESTISDENERLARHKYNSKEVGFGTNNKIK